MIENRSLYGLDIHRLRLQKNNLVTLNGIFDGLPELQRLNLSSNDIKHIAKGDFQDQINLLILELSNNPITRIDPGVFVNTISLEYILLLDLQLQSIRGNVLAGLTSLKAISTSDNRLCCLLDQRENVTCARTSPTSPLETCDRLYPSVVLRIAGWVIGLTSLIGNLTVLVLRLRQEQQLTVQTLLIMNLAVADCLMGIYMIIITSADIYFGSIYFLSAPIWRESHLCKFSSFLAFLSSECSVFTLALMTVDRFVCIIFPFGGYRLTVKSARVIMMLLWLVMCILSVIPNLVPSNLPGFYGLSDVCVGLPLHAESEEIGKLEFKENIFNREFHFEYVVVESTFRPSWLYAIATFIGVNMILFIIILICYIMMFIEVKRSTQSVANTALRNREIKVARKMAFIVGTDFACWMPIIVMGILTQSGLVDLPTSLYAWSVIFIIPINSSINPILYTFVNYIENKKKPEQARRKTKVDGMTAKRASVNVISLTELNNGGHL
ncbi:G-protein coupled receptor GRL101-like [Strongylocentrotus purpuratus]|uniref:G-protein coupled receptors family 1 profile domain-containing protein n=1 Tax=Strongylocentrotus purpuratus TaxID=7668 RepID=A0A7M7P8U1_STRPU|nr:G-protein coupled receptor GRL101-like [Strongylocentrotus purpuratus]